MKKTIKLAVVAALALGATSAFATNGSNLIGLGAKSRGMGGVGIGMSHGAESGLVNPALISGVENTEISFGGTLFMPKVKNTDNIGATESASSAADMSMIPEVSIASKVNNNFYWGIGMWGTAGMGVDYRDSIAPGGAGTGAQMRMVTNLQLMQFGVPLAFTQSGFSVGVTPVLQYGSLDINYNFPFTSGPYTANQNIGAGVAQDLQFGFDIGLAYEKAGFTVGATYKSQIDMEYKGVLSTTVTPFTNGAGYSNDKLSTPAEVGLGVSYDFKGNTFAIDYKQIKWSEALGYKDFMWEDQNVYIFGYQYATDKWAVRLGYNHGNSPIKDRTGAATNAAHISGGVANTFNLLGFPGIVESHITVGGSVNINKQTSVDLAYMYAPEVSNTYKNWMGNDITTKHSQSSISAQLNYAF